MMKKKQKVIFGGANPVTGVIYACVIGFALMYTVCRQELLICTIAMSFATASVYSLLYILHKWPAGAAVMTGILTTACFGVILIITFLFVDFTTAASLAGAEVAEESYIFFLFTPSAQFRVSHAVLTISMFSLVIGFICCYFSVTMPRIGFLLLPALIPLILSTRTSQGLPMWLIVMLITAYLMAACCTARPYPNSGEIFTDNSTQKHRAVVSVCLAAAAAITAAALPKSEETAFESVLNAVALNTPGFFSGAGTLGNFAVHSTMNTGNNEPSDTVLFTANTDTPVILDRCSFDTFLSDIGWCYLEAYDTGYDNWQSYSKARRPSDLFNALKEAAEDGQLEEYADMLLSLPEISPTTGRAYIKMAEGTRSSVILHPQGTYKVSTNGFDIYRTPRGELFTQRHITPQEYLVEYNAEIPCPEYAAAVSAIDFSTLIADAVEAGAIDLNTANAFLDEYHFAQGFREAVKADTKIDDEIVQLSREITEGCSNDYEKAHAIEKWFGENGFVYDMEFVPESTEPSYFLFDSKRGICSDFATSLTLLARAAGLSARYTEGFTLTSDIQDEFGTYHVTEANSHAYTQIYIAGCGWVTFDATRHTPVDGSSELSEKVMDVIIISAVSAAALLVLILIFRRQLSWLAFSATYPLRSKRSRIKGVYLRARTLACEINGKDSECTTTGETQCTLSNVLSMPEDARRICTAADELMYSQENTANADTKELYRCLKRLRRRKRELK